MRPVQGCIGHHKVIDENMSVTFFHIRSRCRVPSEVVPHCAPLAAAYAGCAVDQGVVVHPGVTAVEDMDTQFAVHKNVARANGAFGYLEEESALAGPCLEI